MLTTLGELPWWVAPILGLAVGALVFLAGTVADKARMRRWGRELEGPAPVRPASDTILPKPRKEDDRG